MSPDDIDFPGLMPLPGRNFRDAEELRPIYLGASRLQVELGTNFRRKWDAVGGTR